MPFLVETTSVIVFLLNGPAVATFGPPIIIFRVISDSITGGNRARDR